MKTGKDADGDEWLVDGRLIERNGREMLRFKQVAQALHFAAAICEEAGEEGLAKLIWERIREKGMTP